MFYPNSKKTFAGIGFTAKPDDVYRSYFGYHAFGLLNNKVYDATVKGAGFFVQLARTGAGGYEEKIIDASLAKAKELNAIFVKGKFVTVLASEKSVALREFGGKEAPVGKLFPYTGGAPTTVSLTFKS